MIKIIEEEDIRKDTKVDIKKIIIIILIMKEDINRKVIIKNNFIIIKIIINIYKYLIMNMLS
jgi:hypothetical protein